MNTTENNKLIAKFMGLVTQDEKFTSGRSIECTKGAFTDYEAIGEGWLHYHTSWDWLMPVVEKIETISTPEDDEVFFYLNTDASYLEDGVRNYQLSWSLTNGYSYNSELSMFQGLKHEATYKAVIEFIKWYNNNKSNN